MTRSILFVCLGNICRSPSAEGVVRERLKEAGMEVLVDSAGTGDWHVGKPPYGPMQEAARARGYELGGLRARQVSGADFHRFDLILAMDDENYQDLARLQPSGASARLARFTDYVDDADFVPDPYYTRDFDGALDLIERAADGLVAALRDGENRTKP
ncbi:low molecular weight protein-tyrosine-phosphatase [Litorisediminicola beolgyonensis]|uniref:protein-tyrosine-phosphatase n=1 Tax=Litorisediminicola beolgyonensis TaxID=1173614 RepID=A0ABW3ZL31_9RHOB